MGENIIKDIFEVYSRLFDHRPALQGHISYFMKEFEEKRGSSEITKLESSDKQLAEIQEKLLPRCLDSAELYLTNVITKLADVKSTCEKIVDREGTIEVDFLAHEREKRAAEWTDFMRAQCEKSQEVDEDYERKISEIADYYHELESKLKLSPTTP